MATWATSAITANAVTAKNYAVQLTSKAYEVASPALQSVVTKIKGLDFKSYAEGAKAFMKSDLGVGFGLISVSLVCFGAALRKRPMECTMKNIGLIALGCLAMVASATVVLKPGFAFSALRA